MPIYRVYGLDVWGNRKDGYEINDYYQHGTVNISDSASDKEVITVLRDEYLKPRFRFTVEEIGDSIIMISNKDRPVFELRREEDSDE